MKAEGALKAQKAEINTNQTADFWKYLAARKRKGALLNSASSVSSKVSSKEGAF